MAEIWFLPLIYEYFADINSITHNYYSGALCAGVKNTSRKQARGYNIYVIVS